MPSDNDNARGLTGAYGTPYDPSDAVARLELGDTTAWDELWEELHHQGDVGAASYGAVPDLVRIHASRDRSDWNTYALIATIEIARLSGRNPPLPSEFADTYQRALAQLSELALADYANAAEENLVSGAFAILALRKGQTALARMAMLTEGERQEMLDSAAWG